MRSLTNSTGTRVSFGLTVFLGAFLLFSLEPLAAKKLLPSFGGSAAVWATCLVFFQSALLAGYAYSRLLTTRVPAPRQWLVHSALLLASVLFLPVGPHLPAQTGTLHDPTWLILGLLAGSVGLPFLMLSATGPAIQHWFAGIEGRSPFWLFAVSNAASLLALLTYPVLIEPRIDLHAQSLIWSSAFIVFVVLCATSAWQGRRAAPVEIAERLYVTGLTKAWWFALSACGSMLLLAITNHITQNVAAVPLLWVLPLAVYLLTFILAFGRRSSYRRQLFLRILAVALGVLGYALYDIESSEIIQIGLPLFLLGLFACCMFCHGELSRLRPQSADLTIFYLLISLGGAAGAVFVAICAPLLFRGLYELPVTLCVTALLALFVSWESGWPPRLLWIGVTLCMVAVTAADVQAYRRGSVDMERSFYGALRVVDTTDKSRAPLRTLFHGTITHGAQFQEGPERLRPTTYYGPDSGIGIVLRDLYPSPKRVGIVGLGAGTVAAYGRPRDVYRFYEINHQVVQIAGTYFSYLRNTPARIEIVEGDARLSLAQDATPPLAVLAIDAFSGDAIPVHLLTREAFAIYLRHLRPGGLLAFHISNQFLDLAPVVARLAASAGYQSVLLRSHEDPDADIKPADWVLVTRNTSVLENTAVHVHAVPIRAIQGLPVWTDDLNNLYQILKAPNFAR